MRALPLAHTCFGGKIPFHTTISRMFPKSAMYYEFSTEIYKDVLGNGTRKSETCVWGLISSALTPWQVGDLPVNYVIAQGHYCLFLLGMILYDPHMGYSFKSCTPWPLSPFQFRILCDSIFWSISDAFRESRYQSEFWTQPFSRKLRLSHEWSLIEKFSLLVIHLLQYFQAVLYP